MRGGITLNRDETVELVLDKMSKFSNAEIDIVMKIVLCLAKPIQIARNSEQDFFSEQIIKEIGNNLKIHHAISNEPFTKDRFEYVLESSFNKNGVLAELAERGNPGHDITISGIKCSLKTQANRNIRVDTIHISKFMEMGKGEWTDKDSDLEGLRQRFFGHLEQYDRIFMLRALSLVPQKSYELLEIPKSLLLEADKGRLEMKHNSAQMPKPGYCYIYDDNGQEKYNLYFDGGSERKLRIQNLRKEHCIVHAMWTF